MHRRTLLQASAATLAAPALVGLAQPHYTLKFHTFMSSSSNVWLNMLTPWMAGIERDSGGRIRFEAYPSMQLGGAPAQLFDQARDGLADLIWTLPSYAPGRFVRSEAFELPFMMTTAEATSKALWAYTHAHALDEFNGVRLLAMNTHGPGTFHVKHRALQSLDDLRGLKLRGPTRQITKMLGYLGATPVGMPLPQIPEALARGVIDGCVLPWEVVPSVKVEELVAFHSEIAPAGGALYTATFVLGMNPRTYQRLPPDLQRVIDQHSGLATSGWMGKTQEAGDAPARQLALQRGNHINQFSPREAQAIRRQARQVEIEWIQDMDKRGVPGRDLLAAAKQLIDHHTRLA